MNKKLLNRLIQSPKPYLTRTELGILMARSSDACNAIAKRAIQSGYLERVKRGLYLITSITSTRALDTRELAQFIYGPSYISFESALSFHGWIPEAVRVLTSASLKRKKEFNTSVGTFVYERVPSAVFPIGVRYIKTSSGAFLMASPWKALADLMYAKNYSWSCITEMSEDLRIEPEYCFDSDLELLKLLSREYSSQRVRDSLKQFYLELTDAN